MDVQTTDQHKGPYVEYRGIYNMGEWILKWTLNYRNYVITGTSGTVRGVYKQAKKAAKRIDKANRWLSNNA